MKTNLIKSVGSGVTKFVSRSGLKVRKYGPEILLVTGVVGVVTATVVACKASTKAQTILDEHEEAMETIHKVEEEHKNDTEYTREDARKDTAIVYFQTGVRFVKLYAPAVSIGLLSIGCLFGSYGILKKRNLGLMAAYKALDEGFKQYRKRVVEELGEEKDREFRFGDKKHTITAIEMDENGKTTTKEETVYTFAEGGPGSIYARDFNAFTSTAWDNSPEYNVIFLNAQQNYANDLLRTRGHLFLNEVYDMLGLDRTREGAVVGWVMNGDGDNFVEFRVEEGFNDAFEVDHTYGKKNIRLDFNVDGVILDMI